VAVEDECEEEDDGTTGWRKARLDCLTIL